MSEPTAVPVPLIEQIALAIAAVLEAITGPNGFQIDVAKVIRPTWKGTLAAATHMQCVLDQGEPDPSDAAALGTEEYAQEFFAALCIRPAENDGTPFDTLANLGGAELRRALLADPLLGGLLCEQLTCSVPRRVHDETGVSFGIEITVTTPYRTREGDPYTAA